MRLTEEQKDLIYYVLSGFLSGCYYDDEYGDIDFAPDYANFQMYDLNELPSAKVSLREFQILIEKTMDMMCKE